MNNLVVIQESALAEIIEKAVLRALEKSQPRQTGGQRMLNAKQAAEYLGMSQNSIYVLTREGKLPCIRVGTAARYNTSELDKLHVTKMTTEQMLEDNNRAIRQRRAAKKK